MTIWFHQPQGLVRAWGPSRATARRYARLAGVRYRDRVPLARRHASAVLRLAE